MQSLGLKTIICLPHQGAVGEFTIKKYQLMTKSNKLRLISLTLLVFIQTGTIQAQSLTRPHIWIKEAEKQKILDKIDDHAWTKRLYDQYVNRVEPKKDAHKAAPSTFIGEIPALPGNRTKHRETLTLGYEAALLYWLTDNNDYGQLAADILFYYTEKIAKVSGELDFYTSTSYLEESREAYTKPPMIYDFVYAYLKKPGTKVYNKDTDAYLDFDFADAQKAFKKMADQVFLRGLRNNNHPVLEAPGALFNVLAIDNDATRNTYFTKFLEGTDRQNGLNWMIDECLESGLWPESTGYSIGPHRIVLHLMEITDRYDPSLNIIGKHKDMLKNVFFYENYRYPDNTNVMRFGDAHRKRLNTQAILERVLTISKRKGYNLITADAENMLKAIYGRKPNGFKPSVSTQTLGWYNPLYLLWVENVDWVDADPIKYSSSIAVDYSGIAMQRNIFTSNTKEYGLMGYTGGAHYVHSHLTGIDLELYGLGTVLGTGGGDSDRNADVFRNYHRIYAGHNTVIINGKSKGQSQGSWKSDNQLKQNKTKTVAAEPASQQEPVSKEFSFSAQVLDDQVNNAKQQRVFSIIRTSDTTGYYFDLFRSKSLGANNYHDYIYHNVGDGVNMVDGNNNALPLADKTGRYTSTRSDFRNSFVMFPGWHYFEDVKTSSKTTTPVKATIPMTKSGKRYIHIVMPGGEEREYTACKGPKTLEATLGYTNNKTPIVTVRHYGEAWTKPFISIFEPSRKKNGSVVSVENLYTGTKIVGAKVISTLGGKNVTDYIISNENANDTYKSVDGKISFTGRFGIVRLHPVNKKQKVTLYIGEGTTLSYSSLTLNGDANKKGLLVANNPEPEELNRVLEFKNLSNNQEIAYGTNLTIEAIVGNDFTSVSLWHGTTDLGTLNKAPYSWSSHDILTNMTDESYTFKLLAKDASNVEVEKSITIKTLPNTAFKGAGQYTIYNPNKAKWMGYQTATNDALVTSTGDADSNIFNIVANGDKYTIYTGDKQKILIINAANDNMAMLATPTKELLSSGNALFSITETGADTKLYIMASGVLDDGSNINVNIKSNGTDVGRGTSILENYKWKFTWKGEITTSTSELKENYPGISVYPNPASSSFTIALKNTKHSSISIYNTSGKLVFFRRNTGHTTRISKVSEFIPGIYFIKAIDDNGNTYHQKLMVK